MLLVRVGDRSAGLTVAVGPVACGPVEHAQRHRSERVGVALATRQVLLGSMSRSELERTIIEPAKKVELLFDPPSLVQRILDEAGEDEGMLPLLQYALKETWARRQGNRVTGDSYAQSGDHEKASSAYEQFL